MVKVAAGALHSAMISLNGELYACGDNRYGQLGLGDTKLRTTPSRVLALGAHPVKAVSCGCWHTVALEGAC